MASLISRVSTFVDDHLYMVSILFRVGLVMYSVLHDNLFRVKYTDIDYMIVVDGARFILQGQCPFARTTYRYTPILALFVLPSVVLFDACGKLIFTFCDVAVMYLCDKLLTKTATRASKMTLLKLFIAFNPVVLNVSTRGNSDTLITLLTMIALVYFDRRQYVVAAGVLGFAAHFKIYPLIYVPPLVFGVWANLQRRRSQVASGSLRTATNDIQERPNYRRVLIWLRVVLAAGVAFVVMFTIPTVISYLFCGQEYIDEAFLYHVVREDHRHNFSPYWLLMYLNMAGRVQNYGVEYAPGLLAFLPQVVVLLFTSWMLRRNVAQACCVVTVFFIAFNKVCTVQYFVWFIPLLPFVFYDPIQEKQTRKTDEEAHAAAGTSVARGGQKRNYKPPSYFVIGAVFAAWCGTIPIWVMAAYPLEFLGDNDYGRVWLASALFFLATVTLGGWLARVSYPSQLAAEKAIRGTAPVISMAQKDSAKQR